MRDYNRFFYANVCHVCKRSDQVSLKRCGSCKMISYCTREHQKKHWLQHKDLCNAICCVLRDNRTFQFFNKRNYSVQDWTRMKMNLMLMVAIKINRKLEHYEEQMFKFLKACIICHDRDTNELTDCSNCHCISFCTKHMNDLSHKEICPLLRLSFKLDVALMTYNRKEPEINIPYRENKVNLPRDMKDFIDCYTKSGEVLELSLEEKVAIDAEYLTRPLTFLYAMQTLNYLLRGTSIVIHVIAANMIEVDGIALWEIILHWLPNVMSAKIILIGPELYESSISIDLCTECTLSNKQLSVEMHGVLYNDYASSTSYLTPHFIIGYNAGIHEYEDFESEKDTWVLSLKEITKQHCPLVLTSYTMLEAEKEQIRLKAILGANIRCTHFSRNPYSSLRPYRDFETEGVYHQNQYIIIYKDLNEL